MGRREYYVLMREDTNSNGLRQWFYFQASCGKPLTASFRIYKFTKRYSLYSKGMKPYIKAEGEWAQGGDNVAYAWDDHFQCYYLAFTYTFTQEGQSIEVANMPPYTYSRLLSFFQELKQH